MNKTLFDTEIQYKEAKALIKNGANVNEANMDMNGQTPLHMKHHFDILKLLIHHGADVNIKDENGYSALHVHNDINIIRLLIKNGADVNATDNENYIPLQWYIHISSIEKMNLFLKAKADLNHLSDYGTALSMLYSYENSTINYNNDFNLTDVVEFVIKNGGIASDINTYQHYRHLFTKKQQEHFDVFALLTNTNDDQINYEFFKMCLAYQNDHKNHDRIEIKDINLI